MTVTDWANVARCAEQRMDALWEQACRSNYRTAEENLCARWREHDSLHGKLSLWPATSGDSND
jgi:hypothetical protein